MPLTESVVHPQSINPNDIDCIGDIDTSKLLISLKPHQLLTISKARELESGKTLDTSVSVNKKTLKTNMGVICDKVGSGKTLSVLGIISDCVSITPPREIKTHKSHSCGGYLSNNIIFEEETTIINETVHLPINIIIVPHTIFNQWEKTIKSMTTFRLLGVKNNKTLTALTNLSYSQFSNGTDIVLVTNKFYNNFVEEISNKYNIAGNFTVSRVIYDEVDSISIPSNRCVKSSFYWGVTATYDSLYYADGKYGFTTLPTGEHINTSIPGIRNSGFLKDLFRTFQCLHMNRIHDARKIMSALFLKNDENFIENSFKLPKIQFYIHKCDTPKLIKLLCGIVNEDVISMLNAGDIDGAIDNFNGTKAKDDNNLLDLITIEYDKSLKNAIISLNAAQQYNFSSESARKRSIEKHENEIIDIEGKIQNLKERISESNMCPICCDEINNRTLLRCCNNSFCFECITTNFKVSKTCPCCRSEVKNESIIVTTDRTEFGGEKTDQKTIKSKIDAVREILECNKNIEGSKKYLVFSDSYYSFGEVKNIMTDMGINSKYIKGQVGAINKTLDEFKNPDSDLGCLLMNSTFAASGINLENATDLIIYHSLRDEVMKQVIGRAQRPGRTCPLRVHMISYENELKDFNKYMNN